MAIPDHSHTWTRTWIQPWWKNHQDLDYVNEPFNDTQSLDLWRSMGYTQTKFTGDMYDMRNPEPDWISPLRSHFNWQHFCWSVYRMTPGCVLPNHSDTYARFREIYKIQNPDSIYRAVVFLEDWQSGHYFEIDNTPLATWRAGDTIIWHNDVKHLAANMGMTNRYTLQITGVPYAHTFV